MRIRRIYIAGLVVLLMMGAGLPLALCAASDDVVVIGAKPQSVETVRPVSVFPQAEVQVLEMPKAAPVLALGVAPIGAIMAWAKSIPDTPRLPGEWVECNGQEIKDPSSPYNDQIVPDLNGARGGQKRFLRGASESGASGGTEEHNHGADRFQKYGDGRKPVGEHAKVNHLPPYYEVVWIIRIK